MKNLHFNIRVTEIGDVANRLANLYSSTANLQSDAFLKTTFAELQKQGEKITDAVKKSKAVSHLEEADAKRDEAIRVLDKLLKAYETIPVETLKAHGIKLSIIFKKYGVKITEENYSSQSNLIDSLLKDFSVSEVQPSIEALSGMKEAITAIRTTQEHFSQMRSDYEKAIAHSESTANASSFRKPILEMINKKIIPYLVAMQIADTNKYGAFTNEVSKIINDMNEVVKARSKKEKKEEGKPMI